jgi:hypothetical protein
VLICDAINNSSSNPVRAIYFADGDTLWVPASKRCQLKDCAPDRKNRPVLQFLDRLQIKRDCQAT